MPRMARSLTGAARLTREDKPVGRVIDPAPLGYVRRRTDVRRSTRAVELRSNGAHRCVISGQRNVSVEKNARRSRETHANVLGWDIRAEECRVDDPTDSGLGRASLRGWQRKAAQYWMRS